MVLLCGGGFWLGRVGGLLCLFLGFWWQGVPYAPCYHFSQFVSSVAVADVVAYKIFKLLVGEIDNVG